MAALQVRSRQDESPGPLRFNPGTAAAVAAIILSLALHFQPTVRVGELSLRLSLADLAAAILSPVFLLLLSSHRHQLRQAVKTPWLLLVMATTAVMTSGFLIGVAGAGGVQGWALSKYIGWYMLLGYGLLGLLLGSSDPVRVPRLFARVYILALSLAVLAYIVLASLGIPWPMTLDARLSGAIDNPNAFALALLCGVALALALGNDLVRWRGRLGPEAATALLCAGIIFSRSVAALIAVGVVGLIFLAVRRRPLVVLRIAVMAALIFAAPLAANRALSTLFPELVRSGEVGVGAKIGSFAAAGADEHGPHYYQNSLSARLESNTGALSAWMDRPVLGIGLGSFWERQQGGASVERPAMVIHNTALWLLTEFGVVGLAVFAGLFAAFGLFLCRAMARLGERDPPRAAVIFAGLLVMGGWAAMSTAHELMYQRIPWVILGLCAGAVLAPAPRETPAP